MLTSTGIENLHSLSPSLRCRSGRISEQEPVSPVLRHSAPALMLMVLFALRVLGLHVGSGQRCLSIASGRHSVPADRLPSAFCTLTDWQVGEDGAREYFDYSSFSERLGEIHKSKPMCFGSGEHDLWGEKGRG